MFYGINEEGSFEFATATSRGKVIRCPDCGQMIKLCQSRRGRFFFSHISVCSNLSFGEGKRHLFWKRLIASHDNSIQVEVPLENGRRADLVIRNIIVELQFSNISTQALKERVLDYEHLCRKQVWIFQNDFNHLQNKIKLSALQRYIWTETKLPLLFFDQKSNKIVEIKHCLFISKYSAYIVFEHHTITGFVDRIETFEHTRILSKHDRVDYLMLWSEHVTIMHNRIVSGVFFNHQCLEHLYKLRIKLEDSTQFFNKFEPYWLLLCVPPQEFIITYMHLCHEGQRSTEVYNGVKHMFIHCAQSEKVCEILGSLREQFLVLLE